MNAASFLILMSMLITVVSFFYSLTHPQQIMRALLGLVCAQVALAAACLALLERMGG